ncbi:lyase [Sphingomonas naphthae]|uniref:Lyase n=1 Tax=Sphingomonas naphthae TaxID=1813468 RepID=A0ABY7TQF3_9SPHN|nr:lyase [Sphingomonas naphthae]WCT74399.1 lyase [Sphingomonas naphthae]
MSDLYEPESDFLKAIVAEEVPLSGSEWAEVNLSRLIAMTADGEKADRDWATFLLAQEELDTQGVRDALLRAARDEDNVVRAEAILGLARRDVRLALPLVQAGLREDVVSIPLLEAAALCAHPSLIADLRVWAQPSDESYVDAIAAEALAACEAVATADP